MKDVNDNRQGQGKADPFPLSKTPYTRGTIEKGWLPWQWPFSGPFAINLEGISAVTHVQGRARHGTGMAVCLHLSAPGVAHVTQWLSRDRSTKGNGNRLGLRRWAVRIIVKCAAAPPKNISTHSFWSCFEVHPLSQTNMVLESAHTVNINQSTLNEVHGDYHYNILSPGERGTYCCMAMPSAAHLLISAGIAELFKAACPDAFHESDTRHPPPKCHPGTRVDILKEIFDWLDNSDEKILWMSGPADAGKSTLAQEVAEKSAKNTTLAASFFFFHAGPGRDSPSHLVASMAYQMAVAMDSKRAQIGSIVEADPSILRKPLEM